MIHSTRISCLILIVLLLSAATAQGHMRVIQTRHYTIHSDLPADLTTQLAHQMDAMYDEYTRRLDGFRRMDEEPPLEAYLFSRRADYAKIVGEQMSHTGGVFIPGHNRLVVVLEGNTRIGLRRVLQHEAFHQFAHNRISPNPPIWLNEGLAVLFEEGLWTGDRFIIGEVPAWRVALLRHHMQQRRLVSFRTFMDWSPHDWNQRMMGDPAQAEIQYNQAWAMVHFLVYATEGTGQPFYRERLIHFLNRLHRGQDPKLAFVAAFSDNIEGFQTRFVQYARQLNPTPLSQYQDHVLILATLLKTHGTDTFATMAEFRSYVQRHWNAPLPRKDGLLQLAADPTTYFSFLNGQLMPPNCLYFERRGTGLPDIICEPMDRVRIRATFVQSQEGSIELDLLLEST